MALTSVSQNTNTEIPKSKSSSVQNNEDNGNQTLHDGASVFTSSLIEGKGVDGVVNATTNLVKSSISSAVKSLAGKLLNMLLGGNDLSEATSNGSKTTAHIADGTKTLNDIHKRLMDANLDALTQLVTTGNIDIQNYANQLTQIASQAVDNGLVAVVFSDKQQQLSDRNKEIESILNEHKITVSTSKPSTSSPAEVSAKDSDGNEIPIDSNSNNKPQNKTDNGSNSGSDVDIPSLLAEYKTNNDQISALGSQISDVTNFQGDVVQNLKQGAVDVAIKGKDLGQVISKQAKDFINEGTQQLTKAVFQQVGIFQSDAVSGYTNGVVDATAANAAPVVATSETVGTLGFGSGHAATVLANGVADGVASGIRNLTGSSAVGGIVGAFATGKGLSAAISTTLTNEATNFISNEVGQMVTELTNGVVDGKALVTQNKQELEEKNLVKNDDKNDDNNQQPSKA